MSGVALLSYDIGWVSTFGAVREQLLPLFAGTEIDVEHIGSTAVPGLSAKPVLDVLLGAASLEAIERRITPLAEAGYEYRRAYEQVIPDRRYFVRPGPGRMRVHLHGVVRGGAIWRDHLFFRDALRGDPSLLAEYQALKSALAVEFHDDKDAYTAAKSPFIQRVLSGRLPGAG